MLILLHYLRSLYNKYVFIDSGSWSCCILVSNRWRPIFWRITLRQRSINGSGSAETAKTNSEISKFVLHSRKWESKRFKFSALCCWARTALLPPKLRKTSPRIMPNRILETKNCAKCKPAKLSLTFRFVHFHSWAGTFVDVINHCSSHNYLELWERNEQPKQKNLFQIANGEGAKRENLQSREGAKSEPWFPIQFND